MLGTENCRLGTTSYGGRPFLGELDQISKGPLTTLDIENTFNMDRDQNAAHERWEDWEARNLAQDDPCSLAT